MNKQWLQGLSCLLRKKYDYSLGVDISPGAVRLVELRWDKHRPVLVQAVLQKTADSRDMTEKNLAAYAAAVLQAFKLHGFHSQLAFAAVSDQQMQLKEFTLPVLTPQEIAEALKWEINKTFVLNDYCYDYWQQNSAASGIRVMAAISPASEVELRYQLLKRSKLETMALEADCFALGRNIKNTADYMIIYLAPGNTRAIVYHHDAPCITRGIMPAAVVEDFFVPVDRKISDDLLNQLIETVLPEVRRLLELGAGSLSKIFLCGAMELCRQLSCRFGSQLSLPVVVLDPLKYVEIDKKFAVELLRERCGEFAVAMGLALRGERYAGD